MMIEDDDERPQTATGPEAVLLLSIIEQAFADARDGDMMALNWLAKPHKMCAFYCLMLNLSLLQVQRTAEAIRQAAMDALAPPPK